MNFKSKAAYNAWLKYGHASGEFAKTPGNQPVSIKGKSHGVQHAFGGAMYAAGGSFNNPGFAALPKDVQAKIKARTFADGGSMAQLTEFNEGGRHEENPIGGIPQGFAPDGLPNLVEEGETKLNSDDYIYSDTLKVTKDIALDFSLSKNLIGKTFAEASKIANRPKSRRENDTIEEVAIKRDLDNLMQAQEEFKKRDLEKDMQMMMEKHPQEMQQLMAGAQMAQQVMPQEGMAPEEMMAQEQVPQSAEMGMPQGQPVDPSQMPPEMLAQMQGAQQGAPIMRMGGNIYMCGGKMYNFGGTMYAEGGPLYAPGNTPVPTNYNSSQFPSKGGDYSVRGLFTDEQTNEYWNRPSWTDAEINVNGQQRILPSGFSASYPSPYIGEVKSSHLGYEEPLIEGEYHGTHEVGPSLREQYPLHYEQYRKDLNNQYDFGGFIDDNNNAIGGAAKGYMSGAATGASIGLNPALLAATGGLSALAIPIGATIGGVTGGIKGNKADKAEAAADEEAARLRIAQSKAINANALMPDMNNVVQTPNKGTVSPMGMMGQSYNAGGWLNNNANTVGNTGQGLITGASAGLTAGKQFDVAGQTPWGSIIGASVGALSGGIGGAMSGRKEDEQARMQQQALYDQGKLQRSQYNMMVNAPQMYQRQMMDQMNGAQVAKYGGYQYPTSKMGGFLDSNFSMYGNADAHSFAEGGMMGGPGDSVRYAFRPVTEFVYDDQGNKIGTNTISSEEVERRYNAGERNEAMMPYWSSDGQDFSTAPRYFRTQVGTDGSKVLIGYGADGPGAKGANAPRMLEKEAYVPIEGNFAEQYDKEYQAYKRGQAGGLLYEDWKAATGRTTPTTTTGGATTPSTTATGATTAGATTTTPSGTSFVTVHPITGATAKPGYHFEKNSFYDFHKKAYDEIQAELAKDPTYHPAPTRPIGTAGDVSIPLGHGDYWHLGKRVPEEYIELRDDPTLYKPTKHTFIPSTPEEIQGGSSIVRTDAYGRNYRYNLAGEKVYIDNSGNAVNTVGTEIKTLLTDPGTGTTTSGIGVVTGGTPATTTTPTGGPVKATTTSTIVPAGGTTGTTIPATGTTGTTVIPGTFAYGGRLFNMPHSFALGGKFEGDPVKGETRYNDNGNLEMYNGTEWELVTDSTLDVSIDDDDREAKAEYKSNLKSQDEKLKDRNLNLEMNQSLPEFLAVAAPAAYNLGQGIFGRVQQLSPQDYMVAADMQPYQYNIDPQLRAADQSFAQGQEALRNAGLGGGNYATNMQQLANSRNQAIGGLYADKQNADAASYNQAMAQNKAIESENLQRRMGVEDFNRQAEAAKTAMLQTGLQQLAQVSEGSQAKKIQIALMQALAPEFANTMSYNSIADQYLNLIKAKRKEKKDSKTTKG